MHPRREGTIRKGTQGKFAPWKCQSIGMKYTPLSSSRETILRECLDKEFKEAGITSPKPLGETVKTDKTRYCRYHQSCGHNTDDCYQLHDAIEEIIRNGKLVRFTRNVREEKEKRIRVTKRETTDPKKARVLDICIGFTFA